MGVIEKRQNGRQAAAIVRNEKREREREREKKRRTAFERVAGLFRSECVPLSVVMRIRLGFAVGDVASCFIVRPFPCLSSSVLVLLRCGHSGLSSPGRCAIKEEERKREKGWEIRRRPSHPLRPT